MEADHSFKRMIGFHVLVLNLSLMRCASFDTSSPNSWYFGTLSRLGEAICRKVNLSLYKGYVSRKNSTALNLSSNPLVYSSLSTPKPRYWECMPNLSKDFLSSTESCGSLLWLPVKAILIGKDLT